MPQRPSFILSAADVPEQSGSYPGSAEVHSFGRALGEAAGLQRMGVHLERVVPGSRTSWPHAEESEEEFVYVLEGELDAWVDGELHRMKEGDFAAFPSGTGICHTFINNGARDALLLVGGERSRAWNRIYYPHHPQRRAQMAEGKWWDGVPGRVLGPHDGLPDALRGKPGVG